MKIINISLSAIYSNVCDMIYDFVIIDNEPLSNWSFLIDDIKTPEAFLKAVTTDFKTFTYLSSVDLDSLEAEYNDSKEDAIIVVYKGNKPWVSVLFSQLNW
jgi:hypothetical protein